jgi:hypothetical protein
MRKLLFFLFLFFNIIACKKSGTSSDTLQGVWIEKTQRLDTINFDNLAFSTSNPPTFDLRSQPAGYSSLYNYSFKTDSILLRSFFSSYSGFYVYYFKQTNSSLFSISNFYHKPSLPATLQFERIR